MSPNEVFPTASNAPKSALAANLSAGKPVCGLAPVLIPRVARFK